MHLVHQKKMLTEEVNGRAAAEFLMVVT